MVSLLRSETILQVAAHVVVVVMGVEDVGDAPAQPFGLGQDRLRHRRIDHAGGTGLGLVQQVDVVVLEDGDLMDLECAHDGRKIAQRRRRPKAQQQRAMAKDPC